MRFYSFSLGRDGFGGWLEVWTKANGFRLLEI